MAKKVVATLRDGNTDGRSSSIVIKMVKSPKTNNYILNKKMNPNEQVKEFFK